MSAVSPAVSPRGLFSYRQHWAHRFGRAPFLPMSRAEMDLLGWDACDVLLVTGDAYIDHPSFGMALIGRLLEAQGFRVAILAQPDWSSAEPFTALGRPTLFAGITAGNMDSMVNRYTADRRLRHNDSYTPDDEGGRRPDRASLVYAQRVREAFKDLPIVLGGIEASLRRVAHYDYWSDTVRRSLLMDARADILVFGNAERAIVEIAHRVARGEPPRAMTDIRGTAVIRPAVPEGWAVVDSSSLDAPGPVAPPANPYADDGAEQGRTPGHCQNGGGGAGPQGPPPDDAPDDAPDTAPGNLGTVVRLPAFEAVKADPVLYAHASRVVHLESNPGNARPLVQRHGDKEVWINPPPWPLSSQEMDAVYELPYARAPHPAYGGARIPAWEMIRFSITILRGCFGGCTFCSITEHEGRIIQNRSQDSVLREVEHVRDKTEGFTGVISDLGGPTANMYRLACKDPAIQRLCRRLSCLHPGICKNLLTDHSALVALYRAARGMPGVKKITIASGLRYDLAVRAPAYVKELVSHHVGGYLKIAPEHTEPGPLAMMMKPGMDSYERFRQMFEQVSREAGKEQYLIPYFIAAHPGTTDQDMMNLALWLKRNRFRPDQVQAFLPAPMALATAMYHSGRSPLKPLRRDGGAPVFTAKGLRQRRLHKAFLRYHDPENWPLLREALKRLGRADLIGPGKRHLVPAHQPGGGAGRPPGHRPGGGTPTTGKPGRAAGDKPVRAAGDKPGRAAGDKPGRAGGGKPGRRKPDRRKPGR